MKNKKAEANEAMGWMLHLVIWIFVFIICIAGIWVFFKFVMGR